MKKGLIYLSLLASVSLPMAVNAETNTDPAPAPTAVQPASTLDQVQQLPMNETNLKKFINASKEVSQIQSEYTQKLQGVQDQNKAQAIQQEAFQKMNGAIVSSGLTLEEYKQIAEKIQQDPELRKKAESML